MPKVSVVIPSHNYGRFLRDCLSGLFDQRGFSDFEVVVVEDGSKDDSAAILKSFTDPRLRVIYHEKNQGHIKSFNDGFKAISGQYVVAGNADDVWRPDFLARAVAALDRHPDVGLVHCNFAGIDAAGKTTWERTTSVPFPDGYHGDELPRLLVRNYIPSQGAMWRRECLAYVGGEYAADIPFAEDWNLYLNIARRHALYFIDEPLVAYRTHGDNIHFKLARAREKERCEMEILRRFFAAKDLAPAVKALRPSILAGRYLENAEYYVTAHMRGDVVRCVLSAFRARPAVVLHARFWQRLTSGMVPEGIYQRLRALKWRLKGAPK